MEKIVIGDYATWRVELSQFLDRIVGSVIHDRLIDTINVVDFLYEEGLDRELDIEEEDIFHTGYLFLTDQVATMRMYLESHFDDDVNEFMNFGRYINLSLYMEDFSEELYQYTEDAEYLEVFNDLEDKLDELIQERRMDESIFTEFDKRADKLSRQNDFDYIGILEIFTRVAEEYGLYNFYKEQDSQEEENTSA